MKKTLQHLILLILRAAVKLIGRWMFKIHKSGMEHVPASGGALVVANHVSYIDFILLICSLPRHASFVMNADVFQKPILRFLFESVRCVPISSRGGKNDLESFNRIVSERINGGELVVIFAEGTVTRTGQLLEFKKGVEHIAKRIQAPIIPVHFFNVLGSPYSFKPGKSKTIGLGLRTIRRPILVRIGAPIAAPVSAFIMRQRIKDLETENLQAYLENGLELPEIIVNAMHKSHTSGWHINGSDCTYSALPSRLRALDHSMGGALKNASCVAILAPKSIDTLTIMCWLMIRRITFVPLPEDLTNEEQLFALNKSKAEWLITTRDLAFTKHAPIADQLIFIEDLCQAQLQGEPVKTILRRAKSLQKPMLRIFRGQADRNELACVLFQKNRSHELDCTALSHQNLLAVITGLRQVYHFRVNSVQLSDIPHSHAHGIVMEVLLPLLHGMNLHIAQTPLSEEHFLNQLEDCQPDLVIATPQQLRQLASIANRHNLPHLTHVFTANVNADDPAIDALRSRQIEVFACAGLNQTSSVFAINLNDFIGPDIVGKPMQQENQKAMSIGKAMPGVTVKITDPNGTELEPESWGALWIKGACVALTHRVQSDCQMPLLDGWLRTNWTARMDAQGFIFVAHPHSHLHSSSLIL